MSGTAILQTPGARGGYVTAAEEAIAFVQPSIGGVSEAWKRPGPLRQPFSGIESDPADAQEVHYIPEADPQPVSMAWLARMNRITSRETVTDLSDWYDAE
jgi:hypothetical protein